MLNWSKDAIYEMNSLPVPEKYVACERFSPFLMNSNAFGDSQRNPGFYVYNAGIFPNFVV